MSKKRFVSSALAIALAFAGSLGAATSAAAAATTERLAGPTRYETAVAISQAKVPNAGGAAVIYLASGEGYPDALAGGPLAAGANDRVLLLVTANSIPTTVDVEIKRLDSAATKYVVLGGPGTISATVFSHLDTYEGVAPVRIAGADRYETAALISQHVTGALSGGSLVVEPPPSGGGTTPVTSTGVNYSVFLASGEVYPDALSGGALAAATSGTSPILLTQAGSLPAATATELARLDAGDNAVTSLRVLGGPGSVSAAVVSAVDAQLASLTAAEMESARLGGKDRYETSALIAGRFSSASKVYIASGENYPDALAGVPLAAVLDVPVLLVRKGAVDSTVCAAIRTLAPTTVAAFGGTGSISDATLAAAAACVGSTDSGTTTPPGEVLNT